jgi:hypothetical protein
VINAVAVCGEMNRAEKGNCIRRNCISQTRLNTKREVIASLKVDGLITEDITSYGMKTWTLCWICVGLWMGLIPCPD